MQVHTYVAARFDLSLGDGLSLLAASADGTGGRRGRREVVAGRAAEGNQGALLLRRAQHELTQT